MPGNAIAKMGELAARTMRPKTTSRTMQGRAPDDGSGWGLVSREIGLFLRFGERAANRGVFDFAMIAGDMRSGSLGLKDKQEKGPRTSEKSGDSLTRESLEIA